MDLNREKYGGREQERGTLYSAWIRVYVLSACKRSVDFVSFLGF